MTLVVSRLFIVVTVVVEPETAEVSEAEPEDKPPVDNQMLLKPPEMQKKQNLRRRKTKTLYKKSKPEVKPEPVEEPPPLTEDESGVEVEGGVEEATSETKSMKRRRRMRRRKRLVAIQKRPWQGSWFW